ncbi:iron ABC transporter permease [Corynebacterium sp. P6145]|uniref:FecCD family ABC transporter permease n=1 Tax=Corynebacterium antarcticum TaxID=2800405 RepID=UPI0020059581|nr:iron ABC transporter permease [Corynebacterium antarcticum]MCK7643302.1 iron ABC transporter permease [Corynebacterium antarcticum]
MPIPLPYERPRTRRGRMWAVICGSFTVVFAATLAGLFTGSHPVEPSVVIGAVTDFDPTDPDHLIVVRSRLPRIALGLVVGLCLGLAGGLVQALTRNPLADPGILGINAGASLAVCVAIGYVGVTDVSGYVWWAFAGAGVVSVVVYLLGSVTGGAASPARLALAGAAITMALSSVISMILLSNYTIFEHFRFWAIGSLQGRGPDVLTAVLPFVAVGCALALLLARPLNAMGLGDESAVGLGVRIGLVRLTTAVAVVMLAGAATAAAGPISFVGLAAPHLARRLTGPDNRVLIPAIMAIGPALLVATDVAGKVVIAPAELQTGIATALLGGPVFIALVRSRKAVGL